MEKKSNTSLIIVVIVLIILVLGLSGFIVLDKFVFKTNNKNVCLLEEDNAKININTNNSINDDFKVLYGKTDYHDGLNDIGMIKLNGKELYVQVEYDSEGGAGIDGDYTIIIGDYKIEHRNLAKIAVMDDSYIFVSCYYGSSNFSSVVVLDKDFNTIDLISDNNVFTEGFSKYGDSFNDLLFESGKVLDYASKIIDKNYALIGVCENDESLDRTQNYNVELVIFKDGKVTTENITSYKNVFCSSQR